MHAQHELVSLTNQRHEEALREARKRRLAKRACPDGRPLGPRTFDGSHDREGGVKAAFPLAILALVTILLGASGCGDTPEYSSSGPSSSGPSGPVGEYVRLNGSSMECYSIASNGQVELRHNGLPAVNDTGWYGNGQITWNSGRISSTVNGSGQVISINGTRADKILSCLDVG